MRGGCTPRQPVWRVTMRWCWFRRMDRLRCWLCWRGTDWYWTGYEARESFLSWLALERRASPLTVEAYGTDLSSFLGFLTRHLGGEPDLTALSEVAQSDVRAWLAALANEGLVNAS